MAAGSIVKEMDKSVKSEPDLHRAVTGSGYGSCSAGDADAELHEDDAGCGCGESRCCAKVFPTGYWPEFKKTIKLSLGLAFIQVCQIGIQPIAVMFAGRLGKLELDTVALANTLINIMGNSIINGMATACDTIFSQTYGSKNKKLIGIQLQRALWINTLALFICYAIHLNVEGLLRLMGQDHAIAKMTARYVQLFMPGMFFLFIYVTLTKYVQCQNIVIPHTVIGAVGLGCHLLFQYLFIYQFEWGIDGSSLAQVAGYFVAMVLTIIYILASKMYKPTWGGWDRRLFLRWGEYFRLAVYGVLMLCLEWWAFEVTIILAGVLGTTELGAQTVVFNVFAIPWAIPSGISIAVSIRIGNELGAGRPRHACTAARVAYTITAAINTIIAIVLLLLRNQLPYIFTNVPEVIDLAKQIVPLLAYYSLAEAIVSVARGIFRGCGKQGLATVIIFGGYYLAALPLGICLMFLTDLRTIGVWIGLAVGLTLDAIVYFVYTNFFANWEELAIEAQERAEVRKRLTSGSDPVQRPDENTSSEIPEPDENSALLTGSNRSSRSVISFLHRQISRASDHVVMKDDVPVIESGEEEVTTALILKRISISALMVGVLGFGIVCRLLIVIPDDVATVLGNVTHVADVITSTTFIPVT